MNRKKKKRFSSQRIILPAKDTWDTRDAEGMIFFVLNQFFALDDSFSRDDFKYYYYR